MIDPAEQLTALAQLADHPGWKLFCEDHAGRFASLTRDVLDTTKPNTEAEPLRQARGRIERDFTPQKILTDLTIKARAKASHTLAEKLTQ